MEYSNLRNLDASTPEVLRNFFNQTAVEVFFEKHSTVVGRKRIITIDKIIVGVVVRDVLLLPAGRTIRKAKNLPVTRAWSAWMYLNPTVQQRMTAQQLYPVMPTTSRVEGDFSLMSYRRNAYCAAMTDFVLEGIFTYAKQYRALQDVANRF
ncbi:PiggyBac transposable element-derived protein domain-containing protein [Plasmodiophora brassicae]